jgi:hypothetical protein
MTTTPTTLSAALKDATMLEIDGLHAWDFFLGDFLTLECMDGRERKTWRFTMEQVNAATFDETMQCWLISDDTQQYQMKCLEAFTPTKEDEEDVQED